MVDSTPMELLSNKEDSKEIEFMISKDKVDVLKELLDSNSITKYSFCLDNNSTIVVKIQSLEQINFYDLTKLLDEKNIVYKNFTLHKIKLDSIFQSLTNNKGDLS
jgi:hypothetical protein